MSPPMKTSPKLGGGGEERDGGSEWPSNVADWTDVANMLDREAIQHQSGTLNDCAFPGLSKTTQPPGTTSV